MFLWVCGGCLGDCFECLSMGHHGPLWASVAFCGQSPKLPTHPHKKHTEASHKLPTTRLHPEKGTNKKQIHTIKQATETMHKLLRPCSHGPLWASMAPYGPLWASLDLLGLIWPSPAFSWLIWVSMGLLGPLWPSLANLPSY